MADKSAKTPVPVRRYGGPAVRLVTVPLEGRRRTAAGGAHRAKPYKKLDL
ncbi:hypothetical protein ACFOY2_33740 [Nonomuraea purpurea]|uniref:Lasso RiPP family leader peptide-containing protein n=1 Tax=Nonomuraea purpurea TaxID=1849276 RepID=A0ABV8GEL8_9ACTN